MRAEIRATSAVTTLSVAAAVGGHTTGHLHEPTMSMSGMSTSGRSGHDGIAGAFSMSGGGHGGVTSALAMSAVHLGGLLAAVALLGRAHRWAQRIGRILARLVPELSATVVPVPAVGRLLSDIPDVRSVAARWLPSNVSRRGPPPMPCSHSIVLTGCASRSRAG
ncbi:MAG TPA: hypothetical protein VFT31_16065 [Kribbella sp.]|nr:hypothetical protein [Kribbella sp.]